MINYFTAHKLELVSRRELPEKKSRKAVGIVDQAVKWLLEEDCKMVRVTYPPAQDCQGDEYWANGVMMIFEKNGWIRIHHMCHPSTPYDNQAAGTDPNDHLRERDTYTHRIYENIKNLFAMSRVHICTTFEEHDTDECGRATTGKPAISSAG